MMRMNFASCILPLTLVSSMAIGQQGTSVTTVQASQQVATKPAMAQNGHAKVAQTTPARHQSATGKHAKIASRKGAKRPAYRPEYTQNSVEVMNGASTQKVVFRDDETTSGSKNAPASLKVEVVNGTTSNTQYFYGDNGRQGSGEKRPVVVAIQSSDTRFAGGNRHPVVTGITAAGRGDARSANGSGQKISTGVSPQLKRPEYQPDAH